MWKVYNIQTGRIIKAGFETDDQAKDWLERRKDLPDDEHDIDEMDEEEEEEFLESESDDEEGGGGDYEPDVEDGEDVREINYPDDDDASGGDDEEEDEDEDEEEEEEREESDDDDY